MFERLMIRAAAVAAARAERRRVGLAARVRAAELSGVAVSQEGDGVVLAGRGLAGRELEVRWLVAEAIDER